MEKTKIGIVCGIVAGVIDVMPMVAQKLTWDANLSAFSLWVVTGFLIANTNLRVNGAFKGIIVAFLVLLSPAILIGWKEPISLLPISMMTLILGAGLGYSIERIGT